MTDTGYLYEYFVAHSPEDADAPQDAASGQDEDSEDE